MPRVQGTAVFMSGDYDRTPSALLHNIKHNHCLHERVVQVTIETEEVPRVDEAHRATVEDLGRGFWRVRLTYGFTETPDVPEALARLAPRGPPVQPDADVLLPRPRARLLDLAPGDVAVAREDVRARLEQRPERDRLLQHPAQPRRGAGRAGRDLEHPSGCSGDEGSGSARRAEPMCSPRTNRTIAPGPLAPEARAGSNRKRPLAGPFPPEANGTMRRRSARRPCGPRTGAGPSTAGRARRAWLTRRGARARRR